MKAFRFKGVDVATEVPATGKRVYLYNLGTGQFIYSGGAWGTAGVTKFEDYGLPMTISKTTNTQYAPDSDDRTFYTLTTDFGGVGGSNRFAIQPGDDSYGSSNNGLVPNGGVWVDQSEGVRWVLVPETDKELTHGANVYRIYYAYDQDYMINPGSKKDPGDDEYQVWLYAAANDALNEQANGTLVRYRKIPTGTTNHQHDNESDIPAATSDDYLYHLWTLVTEDDLWAAFTEAAKGNRAFADATYLMKNPAIVRNMNFGETNIGGKPYIENGWTIDNTIVKPDNEKDGGNHQLDFIGTTNGDNVANYPDALGFSSNLYPMAYWNYLFGGNGEIKQTIEVPAITGWYSFKCNGMNVDPGSNAEMYIKINGTEYGTQKLAANAEDTNSLPVNGTMNVADATAAADARIRAAIVGKNLDDIKNYIDTDNYNALNAWVPNMTEPQLADWYDNGQQLSWNGYDIPGLNKQTNEIYTNALANIVNELTAGNNTNLSVDDRKAQELYLGKVAYTKLQYTNELLFYVGDADIAGKEKVKIEVGFRKPATDPTYAFASFDDVHVTYLGEISFVMDEDYTETIGADYLANEGHENIEVYLKRKFAVGHWNTLVMPIDVDRKTMLQMFGQSVQVAQAIGLKSDKPNVIAFELIDYENGTQYINDDAVIIKACTQENCEDGTGKVLQRLPYYLVKPVTNLGIASRSSKIYDTQLHEHVNLVSDDAENHYLPMGKRNMSTVDGEWYNPVWPWSSYTSLEAGSENYQHNDLQYKATYITTTITDTDFYVIATDDNMYHLTQATLIKGFRFWITDVNNPTGESKLTFMLYQPGDLEEPEEIEIPELTDEPTGIRILNAADAQGEAPRYNLAGQRVGKDYKGVVVVNGKKMLVK